MPGRNVTMDCEEERNAGKDRSCYEGKTFLNAKNVRADCIRTEGMPERKECQNGRMVR
jgi:hypothetical protein